MNFSVEAYEESRRGPALVEVEKARAKNEVQGALVIAKNYPRDTVAAFARIMESCKRITLAQTALYSYPRGGETVTGPSIRLAEVLAQNYGNIEFGTRELDRLAGRSVAESYCWDLETNVRQTMVFEVPHEIGLKGGKKKFLTDPRDIYELVANMGARRRRACILGIIPADITEAARDRCRKTLAEGGGEPMVDRIRRVVTAFEAVGVSLEMLERRLDHEIKLTTGDEIVELQAIYNSLKDKQAKRSDFFDFKDEEPESADAKTLDLAAKLHGGGKE